MLDVVRQRGTLVLVKAPPNGAVAPAGPYMLFVNESTSAGPVPSVAAQAMVR